MTTTQHTPEHMQTTNEILKVLAPEFVALDELYNKWKSPGVNATEHGKLVNLMDTQTRALLDAYAQALVQISELKLKLESKIRWQEQAVLNCAQKDCANYERNLKWYQEEYYRALAKLAEQEWQPIETAPQDGRTIIGWSKYMSEPCTIKWGKREGWVSSWEGYEVVESMCDRAGYKDPEPVTHWLPMPLPPQEPNA